MLTPPPSRSATAPSSSASVSYSDSNHQEKKTFFSFGNSKYRPDIDGLRAIAVLSVVFYHAFPNAIRGGFIGVDIFFVISGYLISSILYRNLFNPDKPGRVNIIDFYIRRIRRIFPALILVLATTLALGWFVLLPEEYKLLGKHVIGGATYVNNLMLYFEAGTYFDAAASAKPLLHLWSLGVEEQFYLVFPIILWLLYKSNLNFVLSLAIFTAVSYALNRYGIHHGHQSASFYLPWCRFWELSAGAILAYIENYHTNLVVQAKDFLTANAVAKTMTKLVFRQYSEGLQRNLVNNIVAFAGIAAIIYGVCTIKNNIWFPGSKALVPVLGAIFIIGAGRAAAFNRYVLSSRVAVFIGLISYPLYLWHWPLLSLAYLCEGQTPASWIRWSALGLAFALSVLTYWFVEPPLRYGKHSKLKAAGLFVALLAVGFLGYRVMATDGFKNRFKVTPTAEEIEIKEKTAKYRHDTYFSLYDEYIDNCKAVFGEWNAADVWTTCVLQKKAGENNIALIGSSHAAHLFYGLSKLAQKDGNAIALLSMGSQSPFINVKTNIQGRSDWYKRITDSYNYILSHKNLKVIVMAQHQAPLEDLENPAQKDYRAILKSAAARSFDLLKDREILLVLDSPWLPFHPSKCSAKRPFTFTPPQCSFQRKKTVGTRDTDREVLTEVAKNYPNVTVIDLEGLFCQGEVCSPKQNSQIMYREESHLNYKGSNYVAPFIYGKVKELLQQPSH